MSRSDDPQNESQLEATLRRVIEEIRGGVRHGHFEITVSGEIVKSDIRRVVVKAGRSYQFLIPSKDIDR